MRIYCWLTCSSPRDILFLTETLVSHVIINKVTYLTLNARVKHTIVCYIHVVTINKHKLVRIINKTPSLSITYMNYLIIQRVHSIVNTLPQNNDNKWRHDKEYLYERYPSTHSRDQLVSKWTTDVGYIPIAIGKRSGYRERALWAGHYRELIEAYEQVNTMDCVY